jgi:hypothetical protein
LRGRPLHGPHVRNVALPEAYLLRLGIEAALRRVSHPLRGGLSQRGYGRRSRVLVGWIGQSILHNLVGFLHLQQLTLPACKHHFEFVFILLVERAVSLENYLGSDFHAGVVGFLHARVSRCAGGEEAVTTLVQPAFIGIWVFCHLDSDQDV